MHRLSKILSLILALTLCAGLFSAAALAGVEDVALDIEDVSDGLETVRADGETVVPGEDAVVTDGASVTVGDAEKNLADMMARYPHGSYWTSSFNGGTTCYGFANMVVFNVFGYSTTSGRTYRTWAYDGSSSSGMVKLGSVAKCTEANVRELLSQAMPGDVVQFDTYNGGGGQHSSVISAVSEDGVTIYECNWYGSGLVTNTYLTFAEFARRQYSYSSGAQMRGTLSLLRSDNYDTSDGGTTALSIYGAVYPAGTIAAGQSFTLKGVIVSGSRLTSVIGVITNASGTPVMNYSTNPDATTYNIQTGGLDSAFRFATLANGSYTYTVTASNAEETKTLISSVFHVGAPSTYTIRYDANGGENGPEAVTKVYGEDVTISDVVPTLPGYTFICWADESGAGTMYVAGDTYVLNRSATLVAIWIRDDEDPPVLPTDDPVPTDDPAPTDDPVPTDVIDDPDPAADPDPAGLLPFTDVPVTASYYPAVSWAYENGIVKGTSATTFSPAAAGTRGQIVLMLYRLAGKPDVTGLDNPFSDVKKSASYYKAVIWAYHEGIIKGSSPTRFRPNESVPRWQLVLMLYRLAGKPAVSGVENPFTDVNPGDVYYNAVLWAYETGVTLGTSATTFSPCSDCMRYQLVTFLSRCGALL